MNDLPRYDQAKWTYQSVYEPLLSEKNMTEVFLEHIPLPSNLKRNSLTLPSLSEPEIARHYTRLSQMTYGIDSGPYLLGSCTMKYNPKFTEDVAVLPGCSIHPDREPHTIQGTLEILHTLQEHLAVIGGMDAVTLQPPAGASGEFTGILIIRAFHESRGDFSRNEIIIPESAHGTNPASATLGGYNTVEIPSNGEGRVNIDALQAALSENTAALMLTNPNTLGLFESEIELIASMVHDMGGLLYYDGANLNALLGRSRPRDMGFDIMHYNVHKTFATPHGGGGPGAGPVGVISKLETFLPAPIVIKTTSGFDLFTPENSIGKVHGFYGNWLCLVKALAYILRLGDSGLLDASAKAVLNANYLGSKIQYEIPFRPFYHEFVASSGEQDAAEVAKRLLDYGVHPPTIKWPLIVSQALLVEPTESENKTTLDQIAASFNKISSEDQSTLKSAPNSTTAGKIDQTTAARSPILSWHSIDPSL
jgi:glycine dehydrogenase subunit 2